MSNCSVKGEIKVLGIDLAKQSFQLHGVDNTGKTVLLKKLSRNKLSAFIANLPPCLIGLEACGGAHHWVRVFKVFGHTVKMIAPQFVKPYVKSNIGDISVFKNGRELAAWLGRVPKQHSTGGKTKLLGISKRGDRYLRTLLIHGGRAVIQHAHKYDDRRSRWISEIEQRRGKNISAVAVANKNARVAWALLSQQRDYTVQTVLA